MKEYYDIQGSIVRPLQLYKGDQLRFLEFFFFLWIYRSVFCVLVAQLVGFKDKMQLMVENERISGSHHPLITLKIKKRSQQGRA